MSELVAVPAALAGERLDRVVSMAAGVSRSVAASLITEGSVELDGAVERSVKVRVEEGALVRIELPDLDEEVLVGDASVDVRVIFEDADVIVVDKPPGLVVHPGAGNKGNTLVHGVLARYPEIATVGDPQRPGIVHRLDKGTSGLLLVARSSVAYESLVAQLSAHTVDRTYATLVWGHPDPPTGIIDAPIGRSQRDPTRMTVSARGRAARTHYRVEQTYRAPALVSLLECRLETGRTHQVRVHLAAIHHPVVGDARYGGGREPIRVKRPLLHAKAIGFTHPTTGRRIDLEAPLPDDFASVLAGLEE